MSKLSVQPPPGPTNSSRPAFIILLPHRYIRQRTLPMSQTNNDILLLKVVPRHSHTSRRQEQAESTPHLHRQEVVVVFAYQVAGYNGAYQCWYGRGGVHHAGPLSELCLSARITPPEDVRNGRGRKADDGARHSTVNDDEGKGWAKCLGKGP